VIKILISADDLRKITHKSMRMPIFRAVNELEIDDDFVSPLSALWSLGYIARIEDERRIEQTHAKKVDENEPSRLS